MKFKSVQYAKYVAEFLYKLHPVVLKEQLDSKKIFGEIFGINELNNLDYKQREQFANLMFDEEKMISSDELSEEDLKYCKYLNDISQSERMDFINFDVYLEVEDCQYGRMLAEFFDNLKEGCLEQAVSCKREEDEDARLIGRYTEVGDTLTEEESKILRENRWCSK